MKKQAFFLSGIMFLALIMRLFHLDFQSFWHDEILSIMLVENSWAEVYMNSYIMTNIPPLFYFIIKPFALTAAPEFYTRLVSAVFAILSIPLIYAVTQKITNTKTATIASLVIVFSSFHVWYSQEMRPYSMLIFLGLLSVWFLLALLTDKKGFSWYLGFFITAAAIFYCHTLGIAFIGFLFVCALIYSPKSDWMKWVGIFTVVGILIAPAIWELYNLPKLRSADSFREFNLLGIPYSFWVFIAGYSLGPSVPELHGIHKMHYLKPALIYIIPVGLFFSLLFLHGFITLKKLSSKNFRVMLAWILLPGLFAILGSIFSNQPFNTRYILLVFPAVVLLWAIGIAQLTNKKWQMTAIALFLLVNLVSLFNNYFNTRYFREDNRAASAFFKQHADKGDLAVCSAFYAKKGLLYYTDHPKENVIGYRPDKFEIRPEIIVADFDKIVGDRERFWLYLSRNFNEKQVKIIRQYCDSRFKRRIDKKFVGVELTYYERPVSDANNNRIN